MQMVCVHGAAAAAPDTEFTVAEVSAAWSLELVDPFVAAARAATEVVLRMF